jgi:8-oxo-dGTP pyrophosphatase MutT (NUDIX family)
MAKDKAEGMKNKAKVKADSGRRQVAAFPFCYHSGLLEILIVTSRETGRFIIPKGWPMKGRADPKAAAIEAREEAGVVGKVHRKPIGKYSYWKRLADQFRLVEVEVYPLEVSRQLETWREKQSRQMAWLSLNDAATLVDEPQLITLIRNLDKLLQ